MRTYLPMIVISAVEYASESNSTTVPLNCQVGVPLPRRKATDFLRVT